jgi:hypothetical protein
VLPFTAHGFIPQFLFYGVRAWVFATKRGPYSAEERAAQELVRDLLRQSRELLNRMQAG